MRKVTAFFGEWDPLPIYVALHTSKMLEKQLRGFPLPEPCTKSNRTRVGVPRGGSHLPVVVNVLGAQGSIRVTMGTSLGVKAAQGQPTWLLVYSQQECARVNKGPRQPEMPHVRFLIRGHRFLPATSE